MSNEITKKRRTDEIMRKYGVDTEEIAVYNVFKMVESKKVFVGIARGKKTDIEKYSKYWLLFRDIVSVPIVEKLPSDYNFNWDKPIDAIEITSAISEQIELDYKEIKGNSGSNSFMFSQENIVRNGNAMRNALNNARNNTPNTNFKRYVLLPRRGVDGTFDDMAAQAEIVRLVGANPTLGSIVYDGQESMRIIDFYHVGAPVLVEMDDVVARRFNARGGLLMVHEEGSGLLFPVPPVSPVPPVPPVPLRRI